ncbi:hypothetical protein, partial [Streptococcus pyogenes]|uniref:hypothetical protein n=1 Tax=Streptococcus pyogenes TaxID=1314 RepID=UPI001C0C9F7A
MVDDGALPHAVPQHPEAGGATGFWVLRDGVRQRAIVNHTHLVIETTQAAEAAFLEAIAERNQAPNGGGAAQVAAMDAALARATQAGTDIRSLTADNPSQQPRAQALQEQLGQLDAALRQSLLAANRPAQPDMSRVLRDA